MFDLSQMFLPAIVEAHGKRWLAVYRVSSHDTYHTYIAVPAEAEGNTSLPLPQPCTLIGVAFTEQELEGVRRRKEREAAQDAQDAEDAARKKNRNG